MRALLYLTTYSGAYSVHRSVNGAGLFGIAFRYVAVRSKALPCILKQNMESWSFPFINDEARRFAKHRVAQVIRYEELGIVKSLSFFKSLYFLERTNETHIINILVFLIPKYK